MIQKFILKYGAEEETLTVNPDRWAENGQSWQRDAIYHGVFQTYTVNSFRFSLLEGGGGSFILAAYEADDIKAIVTVDVYDRNPQTDNFDLSYTGKLNFDPDKFTIDPMDRFVEIGFVQSNILQKFVTRDKLDLDVNKIVSVDGVTMADFVSMPKSITFKKINVFRLIETEGNYNNDFYIAINETPPFSPEGTWYQPGGEPVYIQYYASTVIVNESGDAFNATQGPTPRAEYLYVNESDGEAQIIFDQIERTSGKIKVQVVRYTPSTEITYFDLVRQVYDDDSVLLSELLIDQHIVEASDDPGVLNPYNVLLEFDFSPMVGSVVTIAPANKLRVAIKVYTNDASEWGTGASMEISQQANMIMNLSERLNGEEDSVVDCIYPHEAFTRLFQLITSQENTFQSDILGRIDSEFVAYSLNGEASLDAITTGWNLRQFPGKPFTLTLQDLFKTFDAIYNLMLGYDVTNERFYIERKSQAYNNDLILFDLGEVKELTIVPFSKAYYNEVSGGYDNEGEYQELSGIKEFHTTISYNADQPIKETLDVQAPYQADSIGMEFARRKSYQDYASEDSDYDDLIYIVRTDGSETIQGGTNLSGFKGIEYYYNLALTPRENMIRWADFLKCQFWKEEETFTIRFAKGKKGVNITYTNQNGDLVNEFDDITAADIEHVIRLFNPQYYEFDSVFDLEKRARLIEDPHGLITFSYEGVSYAGFIDEIQTEDYNRQAHYKLIASNSVTDIEKIFMDNDEALFMDGDNHIFV